MNLKIVLCLLCLCPLVACNAGTVRLFSGETYDAKVDVDSSGISVTRDRSPSSRLDLNNIIEANFGKSLGNVTCPAGVLLVNGSFIAGIPPEMDEPTAKIGKTGIVVPTASIARVIYGSMPFDKALQPSIGRTGVILENGDFFVGTIDRMDKRSITVSSTILGPQVFQKTRAFALVFRDVQTAAYRFEVVAKDRRFLVDDLRMDSTGINIRDSVVGNVKIDTKDMVALRAANGRWQAVTGMRPSSVDGPKGIDSANGVRVQPATETATPEPAAIFTAAQTSVSYAVPAGLSFFSCRIEIPKDTALGTRFVFRVLADGRPLSQSPLMGAGDVPQSIRVSLGTARVLTLRIDPTKPSPTPVFGKWIDPILVRP